MTESELTIWTIGHSTRSWDEFAAILSAHGIEALADVRQFPGSRKYPHFNSDVMRDALREIGIEYVPMTELGGRRKARPDSPNTLWRNESFRGYADYMETDAFRAGIERLLDVARRKRTAIMCSEAVWWRCHRSMIADYLKAAGVCVMHILDRNKTELHPYTSPAQIRNGRLTYAPRRQRRLPGLETTVRKAEPKRRAVMPQKFKVGDHVTWNSEAGHVSGTIIKVHTKDVNYKGYTHHASAAEPQYEIQSDKTDHVALHKGTALKKVRGRKPAQK